MGKEELELAEMKDKMKRVVFMTIKIMLAFVLKPDLLFTGVCRYMKHIPDQQQDPLYQQVILLLSLLPVLKDVKVSRERQEERRE